MDVVGKHPETTTGGEPLRKWDAFFVIGVAVMAAVLVLVATRGGPLLDPDSTTYLSGARSLAAGDGYQNFNGNAITIFPPGYDLDPLRWTRGFGSQGLKVAANSTGVR